MTLEERLRRAIENGEVLRISYAGGSKPGAIRDIAPISISGDKVRARCYMSNAVKLFVIDKIVIHDANDNVEGKQWNQVDVERPRYESLATFLQENRIQLVEMGWIIEHGDEFISLHRIGKRGKPLKNPTVLIKFEKYKLNFVYDFETDDFTEEKEIRSRPWTVRGDGLTTKTFLHLDKAAATFLEFAKELAPNKNASSA